MDEFTLDHVFEVTVRFLKVCKAHEVAEYEKSFLTKLDSIYAVTVGSGDTEKVVYIGRRGGNKNNTRFLNGHAVAWKLLAPEFSKLEKKFYFGSLAIKCFEQGPFYDDPPIKTEFNIAREIEALEETVGHCRRELEIDNHEGNLAELEREEGRHKYLSTLYSEIVDWVETVMISDWFEDPPRADNVPPFEMFNRNKRTFQPNTPLIKGRFPAGNQMLVNGTLPVAGAATRFADNMKGMFFGSDEPRRNGQKIVWTVEEDED